MKLKCQRNFCESGHYIQVEFAREIKRLVNEKVRLSDCEGCKIDDLN